MDKIKRIQYYVNNLYLAFLKFKLNDKPKCVADCSKAKN